MNPRSGPTTGRARHHQDGPGHYGRLPGHAQQQAGEHGPEGQGDGHAHHDQPDDDPPRMPPQLPQIQRHARVVEDDRHRQRDQRLERGPQQPLGVDVGGDRSRGEAGRQQEDDGGDPQAAGQHLRSDREGENKADSEQDLVGRHGSFQFPVGRFPVGSVSVRSRRRRRNIRSRLRSSFSTQDMSQPPVRRANDRKDASRPGSDPARSRSISRRARSERRRMVTPAW